MTKISNPRFFLVSVAGFLALAPVVLPQGTSKVRPKEITITGTVTCSKYVYSKPDRKGFTAAEAIRMCASQGYTYVIVAGSNVYNVYPDESSKDQLAKLAGEKVVVTGHVDTDRPTGITYVYQGNFEATKIVLPAN